MAQITATNTLPEPIFVSVKQAAVMLGVSTWLLYKILDRQEIASQYQGSRRLVRLASLREYADNLPTTPST